MGKHIVYLTNWLVLGVIIGLSVLVFFWDAPIEYLSGYIGENYAISAAVFVLLMVIAIVLAPVAVLPLVPTVATLLGPFMTGILSVVGWTVGGVLAFMVARYLGKPVLSRYISLEGIEKYESYIPENAQFWTVVMLRMVVPVDILSYALGFMISMPLWKFTLATMLGVSYFSFAFAYLGEDLLNGNTSRLIILGATSVIIFIGVWYIVIRRRKPRD